jgi:hypothetical protein
MLSCSATSNDAGTLNSRTVTASEVVAVLPPTSLVGTAVAYVKLGAMNSIQVADQTFVAADPVEVGRAVADPASWRRWWPDLHLTVIEDRGAVGHRWSVTGALTGTMEVWLEPSLDGVILNYFLHAEPAGAAAWQLAKMNLAKLTHQRRVAGKKMSFELKQKLEASRPVGMPPLA